MSIQSKFKNWKPQQQRKLLEELLMIHAGTQSDKPMYGQPGLLNIAWHDSPESIHRAFWEPTCVANGFAYDQLHEHMSIEAGLDGRGDQVGNTPEQVIAGIRSQGCWAFTEYVNRTVHLWSAPATDHALLMQMIASEVAHLTPDRFEDEQLEELRTYQMGTVAQISLKIFNDMMNRNAEAL